MTGAGSRLKLTQQFAENREGDRHLAFGVTFAVVSFDSSDEALNNWGGARLEREVEVGVHGLDMPEVLLNSPGLYFSAEAGDP